MNFNRALSRRHFLLLSALVSLSSGQALPDQTPWTGPAPASPADFRRVTLITGLNNPMQLDEAADGRIFILQQTGQVVLYNPGDGSKSICATLGVFHKNEQGGLGLALDAGFTANGWMYFSYTPSAMLHRISRFTFIPATGKLDPASEKILLQIPMAYAAHNAGALIASNGNLYISTGANNQGSGAPSAWITSANTDDLRGKILRIRPDAGGGYGIPDGNMYSGNPKARAEIYSMGHRNPFRFSVDSRTGWLYVAEVGDLWEELNQVRAPGNFGYPQFEGSQGGPMSNQAAANTGLKGLPDAGPTWITYQVNDPARSIPKIEALDRGGGAAIMAGPVYRYRPEAAAHGGLPSYYDGHLFWYDFNKGMIFNTRMGADGSPAETREALAGLGFKPTRAALSGDSIVRAGGDNTGLIDMKVGRHGNLYVLEYFSGALYRIDYVGRQPVATSRHRAARAQVVSGTGRIRVSYRPDGKEN